MGNPQWQPTGGKFGGALAFGGDGDFIDCGHDEGLNITGAVTIAAWIKLSKSADDQKIAGNQDDISGGYKLGIFSDKAELEVRDSGNALRNNRFVDGGTILQPGVWYHIVGTYSQGGSIKTYVNAKLDREQETTNILAASSGPLKIGCEPFMDAYFFNGLIDELSIYNYALSQADIAKIFAGKELGKSVNWIPVFVIVVIAAAAAGLAIYRKKATA
ncbi:MAG: LamG domain-containing protein [Planctomycetes bacterium]|nr:LamG domain-containing protein [Planctomycetota bacterium]